VDTSALMDWHDRFYPPDVFPTLARLIADLASDGRFRSVELVADEIGAIGSADLRLWTRAHRSLFEVTSAHLAEALAIEGRFPGLKDPHAQFDEADAYVIAAAQLANAVVVTAETPAAHKRKPKRSLYIPDVCAALGMPCISNLGMMRREGWKI
jgi:hypothetical protein